MIIQSNLKDKSKENLAQTVDKSKKISQSDDNTMKFEREYIK